jgi:hypothetical protein
MPTRLAEVQRLLEKYRKAVAAHDNVQLARLADSWVSIERSLSSEMEGLAFQLAEAQANGSAITEQLLMRMERYRGLRSDLRDQIMRLVRGDAPRYISANQTALAKLGLTYSQEMLSVVGSGIVFHRLPIGALTSYAGMLGDGTPLFRLLSEAYPYSLDGIIKALLEGTARGLSPRAVAREMANRMGIGLYNITRIARTESMRAFKSSSLEQYRESGVVEGYIRCANKATACLACLALDGEHLDSEEDLDDHPNGYAEISGNVINCSSPAAFITLNYDGDIIVLRTASGKLLTVTAQHPVLTSKGWIAAKFIQKGDDVISYGGRERTPAFDRPNINHIPTLVENIPQAFDMVRLGRVPETSKHLYGKPINGKIDVVFINRQLWNTFDPTAQEHLREGYFGMRSTRSALFSALGDIAAMLGGMFLAPGPFLSFCDAGGLLAFGHFGISQLAGGFHGTSGNSLFPQYSFDYSSGHMQGRSNSIFGRSALIQGQNSGDRKRSDFIPRIDGAFPAFNRRNFGGTPEQPLGLEVIREALFRSMPTAGGFLSAIPSQVGFDRVVEVGCRTFSGHVYALQTQEEWYFSGDIISHNCFPVPEVRGAEPLDYQSGPDWLAQQDEDKQRQVMGDTRYEMYADGMPISDMVEFKQDETWGNSPQLIPIGDLE